MIDLRTASKVSFKGVVSILPLIHLCLPPPPPPHSMKRYFTSDLPHININGDCNRGSTKEANIEDEDALPVPAHQQYPGGTERRSSEPVHRVLYSSASVCSDNPPAEFPRLVQYQSASFDVCQEEDERSARKMAGARRKRSSIAMQLGRTKLLPLQFFQGAENLSMLSPDMEARIYEKIRRSLGEKYGSLEGANRAALTIQKAYRGYKLRRHFEEIRRENGRRPTSRRTSVAAREKRLSLSVSKQLAVDLSDTELEGGGAEGDYGDGTLGGGGGESSWVVEEVEGGGDGDLESPPLGSTLRRSKSLTSTTVCKVGREEEEEERCSGGEDVEGRGLDDAAQWNRAVGMHLFNRSV